MTIRILTEEDKQDLEQMLGQPVTQAAGRAFRVLTEEDKAELEEKIAQAGPKIDLEAVTAQAGQVLEGYRFVDRTGTLQEGEIPIRSSGDLTASGATVIVPAGYYETAVSKEVADSGGAFQVDLETITVTPTKEYQEFIPGDGKAYSIVAVNAIPGQYQDVSGVTAGAEQVLEGYRFVDGTGQQLEGEIPVVRDVLEFANDDIRLDRNASVLGVSAFFENGQYIAQNASVTLNINNARLGRATKADVAKGVTFTSGNGVLLVGEHVCPEPEETTVLEVEAASQLHCWETYLPAGVNRTETDSQHISYQNPGATNISDLSWDTVEYADSYEIANGAIVLVNPRSMTVSHDSDNTVLLGKYIHTGYNDRFYFIPDTASITDGKAQYGTGKYVTAEPAILLEYSSSDVLKGFAVSTDSAAFPENGEQDGCKYIYQGTLSETQKAAVVQALTITENGTYTPPAGVDGYSPVTVNVAQGVQLPAIAEDRLGTAEDLAEGRQLIGPDGTVVTGKMPDRGAVQAKIDGLTTTSYTIPAGSHNGSGTVSLTEDIGNIALEQETLIQEIKTALAGKAAGSGGPALVTKTGTTTSAQIDTGLSEIVAIMLKAASQTATGIYTASYLAYHDILQYTGASVYNSIKTLFTSTIGSDNVSSYLSVNGGVLTWKKTGSLGFISGVSYEWYALGYE